MGSVEVIMLSGVMECDGGFNIRESGCAPGRRECPLTPDRSPPHSATRRTAALSAGARGDAETGRCVSARPPISDHTPGPA